MAHDESTRDLHLERPKLMASQIPPNCTDVMAAIAERSQTYVSIIVAENFARLDGGVPFNMMGLFEWMARKQLHSEIRRIGNEYIRLITKTAPAVVQPHLEALKSAHHITFEDTQTAIQQIFKFEDKLRALIEKSISTAKASGVFAIQGGKASVNGGSGLQPIGGSKSPPHPCMFCAGDHWNAECPNHPGKGWKKTWQPVCTICAGQGGFSNVKIQSSKRLTAAQLEKGHVAKHITANHELALVDFNRTDFPKKK